MNDLQIEYFLAVAKNLSFTKTADEFYVTQPAVSKQISFLEKELGVALFDRTNKATKLTEAGVLFEKHFIEQKKALNRTLEAAMALNQTRTGKVRIGCLEGWNISGFFPELLQLFSKNYPNVEIFLETYSVKGLIQALKQNNVDVILTLGVTLNDVEGINVRKLANIPKILLFSSRHKLANKTNLRPEDFKDDMFFVMSADEVSYAGKLVKEYCAPYGFEPRIQYVRNIESMNISVQNGLGVSISDFWSRVKDNSDFRYIELKEKHEIALAWLTDSTNQDANVLANELEFMLRSQYPIAM